MLRCCWSQQQRSIAATYYAAASAAAALSVHLSHLFQIPGNIDTRQLSVQWCCEMNRWDTKSQSCDAEEEAETTEPVRASDQREKQITSVRQITLFLLLININRNLCPLSTRCGRCCLPATITLSGERSKSSLTFAFRRRKTGQKRTVFFGDQALSRRSRKRRPRTVAARWGSAGCSSNTAALVAVVGPRGLS
jgi:hypothetical protein